jgi:hypothetical protein
MVRWRILIILRRILAVGEVVIEKKSGAIERGQVRAEMLPISPAVLANRLLLQLKISRADGLPQLPTPLKTRSLLDTSPLTLAREVCVSTVMIWCLEGVSYNKSQYFRGYQEK